MFNRHKNACKRGLNTALNVFKLLVAVLLIDKIIIIENITTKASDFLLLHFVSISLQSTL